MITLASPKQDQSKNMNQQLGIEISLCSMCLALCEALGMQWLIRHKWSLMLLCLYAFWRDNEKIDNMRTNVLKAEELDAVGDPGARRRNVERS